MVPIYICEDEQNIAGYLAGEIKKTILIQGYSMIIKGLETKPEALLNNHDLSKDRGIYFLDVDLKNDKYDGFTLAQQIRKKDPRGYIIFVTTHGELAFETFRYKVEAMDYILKDRYEEISSRIASCLAHIQKNLLEERHSDTVYYTVKIYDDIYSIALPDIVYFETSSKKHRIILHSDHQIIEYFDNLQAVEEKLGKAFFRCHRSYLVNKNRIRKMNLKDSVIETDLGEILPLSRKAKKIANEEVRTTI